MTALIIFIALIIGLNYIPILTKKNFPIVEKIIGRVLIAMTILLLTLLIFKLIGYRLKSFYTFSTVCWVFIISTVLFFTLFKNTKLKILMVLLLTPLIILSVLSLIMDKVTYEKKINQNSKILVSSGLFLSCGEIINITQTRLVIFDKRVDYFENLCLIGIDKIETIELDDKQAKFLIYHNGEFDSENPYEYKVESKNVW
ncbi:hypothetical protein [Paucihalobacter sp.]|uniref:hypothetical protein n=1 Tax=Paucihalobacter sp. TaxID=2850405 RepID=UPI002FE41CAA